MAYKRKTRDTWELWVRYGPQYGWEHETTELSRKEIIQRRNEYRENCPHLYQIKVVKRREKL